MKKKHYVKHMRTRQRVHIRRRVIFVLLIFILLGLGFFLVKTGSIFTLLYRVSLDRSIHLRETPEKTINMLLLGVGGGTHDGPDLTDTIIFARIDPINKVVTLISIPRDIWITDFHDKINAAYTYGEEKQKGGGLPAAKSIVSAVIGQPIDYGFKLDFAGFVRAVDLVGGLDITVGRTFDDYAYPIDGKEDDPCGHTSDEIKLLATSSAELDAFPCRYEHIHFDQGPTHMDGTTALKYVRSRHAEGPEGSDFARSARQQKVINAFRQKIFSVDTFLNPVKLVNLYGAFKDNIDTDIKQSEYPDFINLARAMKGAKITNYVIDTGGTGRLGLLVNPLPDASTGYAWIIEPRVGVNDYSEIHQYVMCVIQSDNCVVAQRGIVTPTPTPTSAIKK